MSIFSSRESDLVNKSPDVTLLTDEGEQIVCHRSVLMDESLYFNAMFSSDFIEKSQKCIKIKVIKSSKDCRQTIARKLISAGH